MGGPGSGPRVPSEAVKLILLRGAAGAARVLVAAARHGDREAALAVLAWAIGRPVQQIDAKIESRVLSISAEDIAAALRALRTPQIAAPQAQDTATDSPPVSPLDTATP